MIGNLVVLEEEDIDNIAAWTKGLTSKALNDFFNKAMKHLVEEEAPDGVYWLDEENPFAARYGSDKDEWGVEAWVTHLKSTSAFSGVLCIKDLIQHYAMRTKETYAGTKFEKNFFFYHDALAQMIHADTVAWMKDTIVPGTTRTIYDC